MKTLKRYLFIIVIFLLSFESFGNEDLENSNSQDIEDDIWDTNFKPRLSQDEEQENCNKIFETVKTNSLWEDEEVCELHQKCVLYYLCSLNNTVITDGSILIDPRFDAPTSGVVPPACPSMQKCCTKANYIKNPSKQLCQTNPGRTPEPVTEITTEDYETSKEETITASTPKVTTRTTSTSTVEPDCGDYCIWNLTPNVAVTTDDYIDITTKSNVPSTPKNQGNRKIATTPQTTTTQTSESTTDEPVKPYVDPKQFIPSKKCGFRNENGIGGLAVSMQNKTRYAQYAEFPWMVAVLQNRTIGSGVETMYKGGGSLIHPKVVLTAASNFAGVDPRKIILRAGEWNMASKNELVAHEDRSISKVKRHEDFKGWNYDKNLAILLLNKPFEITAFINTVCLPPKNLKFEGNCLSSGWGKNKFGISGVYQMFLKKVSLPIVPSSECEKKLRKTKLGSAYKLDDGYLCAGGGEGNDLCTGDGGGPLVCPIASHPNFYYQVGLVTAGLECGQKDVPGLYVDIVKHREWIDRKLADLGLADDKYYKF